MEETAFAQKVRDIVRVIPCGEIRTYKEVAEEAGSPHAARAVGMIMARNYDPDIPCHRVIHADGRVGEYNRGGPHAKKRLLRSEGVLLS